MYLRTIVLLSALLACPTLCGANKDVELRLQVAGTIGIDETGAVDTFEVETALTPAIREVVDRGVRRWRFEPIIDSGRPVKAQTRLSLTLVAVQDGDGYRLRIDDAYFGSLQSLGDQLTKHPVHYPRNALRRRLGARVVLAARTDPSGKISEVHSYQVSLSTDMPERAAREWREEFYRAARAAVLQWQLDPVELINGNSAGSTLLIPIMFKLRTLEGRRREADSGSVWQTLVPGPVALPPWRDGSTTITEEDLARLREGEALAGSSRFVPAAPLVGSLL